MKNQEFEVVKVVEYKEAFQKEIIFQKGNTSYRYNGKRINTTTRRNNRNIFKQFHLGYDKLPKSYETYLKSWDFILDSMVEKSVVVVEKIKKVK